MVVGCNPGGNGWGPVSALGRFYEALRDGESLLTPQTVEALTARHRVGMMDHTFRHVMDWGLGFIPNSAPARRAAGDEEGAERLPYHYGRHASRRAWGHSGYRSSTAFCDPEHRLVVAVAFNGTPSEPAHRQRMTALCEAIYEDLGLVGA
jgi:CubicO group peptidase (beta-lactamase class C family)